MTAELRNKDNLSRVTENPSTRQTIIVKMKNTMAGCIFVLLPKNEYDAILGYNRMMESVNLKTNPEQLYAIITTPEKSPTMYESDQ